MTFFLFLFIMQVNGAVPRRVPALAGGTDEAEERMQFRATEEKDMAGVVKLWEQARAYFSLQGIDQWQDGYPNRESLAQDRAAGESYVLIDEKTPEERVCATALISFRPEPDYRVIWGGEGWQGAEPCAVIHRVAVDDGLKGQGLAGILLGHAQDMCRARGITCIRMDTHEDNRSMRRFLEKNGFLLRGRIRLGRDGSLRVAYEKILGIS